MNIKGKFFLLCLLVFSIQASAQEATDVGVAEIDANYCLTLDADEPLREYYTADISAYGFETELEANKVFGTKSNNLITYEVDFANERVIAHLHLDRTSAPYNKEWWTAYLLDTCDKY